MSGCTLLIDTCLNINNIPIDYTDVSAVVIPLTNVIMAAINVSASTLYNNVEDDISGASGLINLELTSPWEENPAGTSDVERNIKKIYINNNYLLGLAKQLQNCLEGDMICSDYDQLKYLITGANPTASVAGFGRTVVRVFQHLFMRHILNSSTTESVNNALNNVIKQDSSMISNIMLNNEQPIKTFIERTTIGSYTADTAGIASYASYLHNLGNTSTIDDMSHNPVDAADASANIVSRLLASLQYITTASDINGDANDTSKLSLSKMKNAISYFLFQSLSSTGATPAASKFHDRVTPSSGAYLMKTYDMSGSEAVVQDISGVFPVMFSAGDVLYFTIDLSSATLVEPETDNVAALKLPNADKLSNLANDLGATRIYLKINVV